MTVSFAAARLQQMRGEEETHESSFYLSKAISALNKNLASPSKRASDSTIATVACLLAKWPNGSAIDAAIHIQGLHRMASFVGVFKI